MTDFSAKSSFHCTFFDNLRKFGKQPHQKEMLPISPAQILGRYQISGQICFKLARSQWCLWCGYLVGFGKLIGLIEQQQQGKGETWLHGKELNSSFFVTINPTTWLLLLRIATIQAIGGLLRSRAAEIFRCSTFQLCLFQGCVKFI